VHELLASSQPAAQHAAALIRHPHRLEFARPQQPRQSTRIQPVGLRPRLRDSGVIRADYDHPLDVRLEDPRHLPAAAGDLQRHPIRRHQALGQQGQSLRRARHPSAGTHLTVLTDRDHAEVTVNVQADRPTGPPAQRHLSPPLTQFERGGRTSGTTTQTDTCSQHNPGESQGRPNEKHGLEAHRANRPTRLRSPTEAPVPDRSTLRPDPDRASTEQFHAARNRTGRPLSSARALAGLVRGLAIAADEQQARAGRACSNSCLVGARQGVCERLDRGARSDPTQGGEGESCVLWRGGRRQRPRPRRARRRRWRQGLGEEHSPSRRAVDHALAGRGL
jgi:hypothetical protein